MADQCASLDLAACNIQDILLLKAAICIAETVQTKFCEIKSLRPEQVIAITQYILRKDVFAVLPTGMGKSLIFQMIPDICSRLYALGCPYSKEPILLVICPLVALISSHMLELQSRGISAAYLSGDIVDEHGIMNGEYSVIFASPESVLKNEKWRQMFQSKLYQENLFGIVTDEVHVVPKWGYGNVKEKTAAFRECFSKLGELRSLVSSKTPILALTATASSQTKATVIQSLSLRPGTEYIFVSPDRPNIYLCKKKITGDLYSTFGWLVELIKKNGINMDKTVIYCKSQKDCGMLFRFFKYELGAHAYCSLSSEPVSTNRIIAMYHHNTLKKNQERVVDSFFKPDGISRVVFATTALGMGVNIKGVRLLIHFGPPRLIEDFIQEMGRAGRDSLPSKAILFYTGNHLRKCENSVKVYARSETQCLRKILLQGFDQPKEEIVMEFHNCCMMCHANCKCSGNSCSIPIWDVIKNEYTTAAAPQRNKRKVTKQQKHLLRELLIDHQTDLAAQSPCYFLPSECSTGFTKSLVKAVLLNCKYVFAIEDVFDLIQVHKRGHAINILFMIRDVFEDIEVDFDIAPNNSINEFEFDLEYGGHYSSSGSSCNEDHSSDSNESLLSGVFEIP